MDQDYFGCMLIHFLRGANIPGKPREALNYAGGVPRYVRECKEVAEKGYAGFSFDAPYDTKT
jgi:hypothetical protein